jgi:hypothetical protein
VRLDIGELAAEQRLGALDGQPLDLVDHFAAAVVALARITLGILVGEHTALRLQHRLRDDVLGGDQFDLVLLALQLGRKDFRYCGIGLIHRLAEEGVLLILHVDGHGRSAFPSGNPGTEALFTPCGRFFQRPGTMSDARR